MLRHQGRLDWWPDKYAQNRTARNRLIAFLRLVERKNPSEVEAAFSGGKYAPPALTDDERRFVAKLKGYTFVHPDMSAAVLVECPEWAAEGLKERFGKSFTTELEVMLGTALVDLRINPLKITREAALAELRKRVADVGITPYSLGLRVHDRPALGQLALLKEGAIEVQDEGSQLVGLLMEAKAGERVVDFCAGAGGKTLTISAQMDNKGTAVACDALDKRLKRSGERFRRAGLHNIETHALQ